MPARRKPKPAPKGKERVEPHFGGAQACACAEAPQDRAPPRKREPCTPRSARGLFTTLTLIALIIVGGFLYFVARLPDPILLTLDDRPPNLTVLASDGTVLAERGFAVAMCGSTGCRLICSRR